VAKEEKMPPITPYLTVKGAARAIEVYKKALGAKENMRMPAEDGKRLMHADMTINGGRVLLCDEFEEYGDVRAPTDKKPAGMAVAIHCGKPADVDALFSRAVKAGFKSTMDPHDAFWGARFAMLNCPFGHRWMMNSPLPAPKKKK
jgi:PhnB protein